MSIPVLPTKLYAPPLRADLIRRPWLTAKLLAAGLHPLTLIAAPAGFGKTTLVSEWLHDLQKPANRVVGVGNLQAAWLALEEDDNDLSHFFTYFLAALRKIASAELGENVLALLQSPQPPPLRSLLNALAHELMGSLPPCVLVLDDYHVIYNQSIHEAVLFLLEHVPNLRWIITTRADPALPLGRLRARRQLLELRAADLRFQPAETAQLLNDVMHLVLSQEAVQELHAKTEGWIAGLQLAGLAMQSSPDRRQFIHDFYGSHRYVADYLADEVLNRLPAHLQTFLLISSSLERMCAELCDAVLGMQPVVGSASPLPGVPSIPFASQLLLEELERTNLFLMPLDGDRRWYRYHHLFGDLLRQRLHRRYPQLVNELHRRAAVWFAEHGQLDDAIRHWLAGHHFAAAAVLLEQYQETLWMQGGFVMLQHWLALLPPPIIAERPRLFLAQVWTHVLTDSAATVITELFQQAETALLPTDADPTDGRLTSTNALHGVLAAIRAVYASKQEDMAGVMAAAQRALTCLPEEMANWRGIAFLCLGFAHEMDGNVRAAAEAFTEAIRLCQATGNHYSALVATRSLARTYLVQGQLQLAAATCTQGLAEATQRGMAQLPNTAHFAIQLGRLHYEWNELAIAVDQLQRGLAILQAQGGSWLQFEGYILLAQVKQAQGDHATAVALLRQAEHLAQMIPFAWTKPATASALVRAWLGLGQAEGAAEWLAQVQPTLTTVLNRVREGEFFTAVRVLIVQGRFAEALALLAHVRQAAEAGGRMKMVVEGCVLSAVACYLQGDYQTAQAMLLRALSLAEPEGYLRTFVDEGEPVRQVLLALSPTLADPRLQVYVNRVLAAFAVPSNEPPSVARLSSPALPEALSAREIELLQLMAAGLSNQEIAERLIITVGTVKSHVNHIFGKLGVQGRVKAINRARELDLI